MKLTKSLLESLIREALEEEECRGKDLEEGNCVSEEEQTLEEKKKKKRDKKKHPLDVVPPHTGKPDKKDFEELRKNKK
jgi:hypothetical protein